RHLSHGIEQRQPPLIPHIARIDTCAPRGCLASPSLATITRGATMVASTTESGLRNPNASTGSGEACHASKRSRVRCSPVLGNTKTLKSIPLPTRQPAENAPEFNTDMKAPYG